MRHRKFTFKIGRTQAHRNALLANAACSLIMSGRIKTTVARAKQIRRRVEKMVTLGKRGTLHARRRAIAVLRQPDVVAHLFSDVAPGYEDRNGGYTRIIRLNPRIGDAADLCLLELVTEAVPEPKPKAAAPEPAAEAAETDAEAASSETAEPGETAEPEEAEEPEEEAAETSAPTEDEVGEDTDKPA